MGVFRLVLVAALLWPLSLGADVPRTFRNPFPKPIATTDGAVTVGVVEFATLPIVDGYPALMMKMMDEPGAGRLFVNDMGGILYGVSYDGDTVTPYLNLKEPRWGLAIPVVKREMGFKSFAFHPQFAESNSPGFGRFYTFGELKRGASRADFVADGRRLFDTVLLEWRVHDPKAAFYDGGRPRELVRIGQPLEDHNGGQIAFNPCAVPGSADFGLLYLGVGDGGGVGDPLDLSQDLGQVFGKILRIDPLGKNSATGRYGVPTNNPFIADPRALDEIYAYGLRNMQNLSWDTRTGHLFVADVGQGAVEEVNMIVRGGEDLGWDHWEGSFRLVDNWRTIARRVRAKVLSVWDGTSSVSNDRRAVRLQNPRADAAVTYPVIEFDQQDPLFSQHVAVTGPIVYRHHAIPPLAGSVLFGEMVSGEVFYFNADDLPDGGQDAIRRVLFHHAGKVKSFLQMVEEKVAWQGRKLKKMRADVRFGTGRNGQIFLLNKSDSTIRRVVPVEHPPRDN